jgi:hypothetical protein
MASLEKGSVRFERERDAACAYCWAKKRESKGDNVLQPRSWEKHRYPNCQYDSIGMVVPVDPDYCTRTCKKKHSDSIRAVPKNI